MNKITARAAGKCFSHSTLYLPTFFSVTCMRFFVSTESGFPKIYWQLPKVAKGKKVSWWIFILLTYGLHITGKNNGSPFLDILGYLKNTHRNPKFGRVRQIPIRELGWEYSLVGIWLTLPNLGFLWVFFKYPKISKSGNPLFFPVIFSRFYPDLSQTWSKSSGS